MKIGKVHLVTAGLLISLASAFGCAFHSFPPFGADWYHPIFFQLLYNRQHQATLGYTQVNENFSRSFFVTPEDPLQASYDQVLNEFIRHKTFYCQLKLYNNLHFYASITETNVDADAIADDGMLTISSAATNQLTFFLAQDILLLKNTNVTWYLQPAVGFATNLWASHIFYSKIAWLKYQMDKFSPRLQAGNFNSNFQAGLSSSAEIYGARFFAGVNARYLSPTNDGYIYGNEVNAFGVASYPFRFTRQGITIEPMAGCYFEKGLKDNQEDRLHKDEDVFAAGQSLYGSFGATLGVQNARIGYTYLLPLGDNGFTEFQLYNKSRSQIYLQYSF